VQAAGVMRNFPRLSSVGLLALIAIGAGVVLGLAGWPQPDRAVEFCGLIFAAILISVLAKQPLPTQDWATMLPSFVIDFASLLLVGPNATMLVATAGTVAQGLTDSTRAYRVRRMLLHAATVLTATQAAGQAHRVLGGTTGQFAWPGQAIPIAAAVVAYCFVRCVLAGTVVPMVARPSVNRSGMKGFGFLESCPNYFIGAGLAVGLVEAIDRRNWQVALVAGLPLYFAYRAYAAHVSRLEEEHRRREVIESVDHGMSVVDGNGQVTLWDAGLEHILGCSRERALGRSLVGAVPALGKTELPRAINETLTARNARTLACVHLPCAEGERILQVKILPVAGGATLLWDDVTGQTHAEHALKRREDRIALAAEGAQDGLWEWDLRSQEFYSSGPWRAMIGLPAVAGSGRPEEWTHRVHPEDIGPLKKALAEYLARKTDRFQHEHRIRHEDGIYRRFLCRGIVARGPGGGPSRLAGSLTLLTDAAGRTISPMSVSGAGTLDPLTGLCNRAVFVEALGRQLEAIKARPAGSRFAVLYLDLDRFKVVNDSLGHMVGDELLIAVSRRLESCLRPGDALARLGGDEFAIFLNELDGEEQANAIAFRLQASLSAPFTIGGREVFTSASIGIAFGRALYSNPDEIMRDADTAMYHAKSRGKARHELFDADMHARELDRLGLENDLRHAVDQNDFEVHYQPIVLLSSGMCVGFESLIRWTRDGKPVSPVTFIPIAEELGLIEPLGTWVLQQACKTFADWQRRFPGGGLDYITVNVSSRQLMQQNFLRIVEQAVHDSGLKPCDLRLEITETALMDSPHEAAKLLRELREFGVKIYLDDFGCGFSSLSHLHKLPVDALKIDRSFVKSLLLPDRPAIVESILALARTLKTSVVAEGIEQDLQASELVRLGCTHAQGYLFSRPLSTSAVEELLVANRPLGPKRVQPSDLVAVEYEAELYHSSPPIKWPEPQLVRDGAEAHHGAGHMRRGSASAAEPRPPGY
jgi:diguanylate cyclase (GGDEF)-like protein/PAS domain S-box-containing protein